MQVNSSKKAELPVQKWFKMNGVARGRYFELKAKRELEKFGWLVERAPMTRFRHDFFGLWDLIAVKNNRVVFIQVACRRKPVAWFKDAIIFPAFNKEFWLARNRKPFKKEMIVE